MQKGNFFFIFVKNARIFVHFLSFLAHFSSIFYQIFLVYFIHTSYINSPALVFYQKTMFAPKIA